MPSSPTFDPNAAAAPGSGLYGLRSTPEESTVHVLPVPWDATASYRKGAALAPAAILRASGQVELFDLATGRPYEAGLHMRPIDKEIASMNLEASRLVEGVVAASGPGAGGAALQPALSRVDQLSERVHLRVREQVQGALEEGRLPAVLGGDHSCCFGAIEACARRHPGLGVLQFDAHADLRRAYQGFTWSHASVLYNVLERLDGVSRLVQVGVRDPGEEEWDRIEAGGERLHALLDAEWAAARLEHRDLRELARRTLEALPENVYLTFDVDGLDPSLCPHTGTPVPGGLRWDEVGLWLDELATSGRRIVGLDLVEVSPGASWRPHEEGAEDAWDAIVGARLLYRLIGAALRTQ